MASTTLDPFETLGLSPRFDLDEQALERRYRELQRALHPDRHARSTPEQRRLSLSRAIEVNEAYRVLSSPLSRADALLARLGHQPVGEGRGSQPADPAFLMEVMELREALAEARGEGDLSAVSALAERVEDMRESCYAELSEGFSALLQGGLQGGQETPEERLSEIAGGLGKARYYERFLDEVEAIEEEALG